MIKPRTGLAAPSQSTLRYLRQLVFPHLNPTGGCSGGNGRGGGITSQCLHVPARQRFTFRQRQNFHSSASRCSNSSKNAPLRDPLAPLPARTNPPSPPTLPLPPTYPGTYTTPTTTTTQITTRPIPLFGSGLEVPTPLSPEQSQEWARLTMLLIKGRQLKQARGRFFEAREEGVLEPYVQRVGVQLMEAYNRYWKHAEAPAIFQHMSLFPSEVGARGLNLCLQAYLMRKDYLKFIGTFKHYTRMQFTPDHKTYELFIRCLVKVGSVSEARDVMVVLEDQRKPITTSAFASFLAGVRDQTASFTELERDFHWIRVRKGSLSPALYNIMIEEALEYGRTAMARLYVDAMIEDGIKPDERTFAAFLRAQAASGDWSGIQNAIRQVTQKGMRFSTMTLNGLLNRFADVHGVQGLERFFEVLSEEECFPSPASFNIMIRAHLEAEDEPGVMRWVSRMRGYRFEPTAATFNTFFQDLRCSHVPRALMYRVYWTVFNMDRSKVDEISRDILHKITTNPEKKMETPPPLGEIQDGMQSDSKKVVGKMQTALQHGRIREAMNVFREASSYVAIAKEVIAVLTRAYVVLPDDQLEIPAVLPKNRDRAIAIRDAFIGYLVEQVLAEADKKPVVYPYMLQIIYGAYKFLEANDLEISHNIANQAAVALIVRSDAIGALHIMNEVSKTRWGRRTGWDLAGLTVLLRAYLVMDDLRGVCWVVDRLVESNEMPDEQFLEFLRRAAKASDSPQFKEEMAELVEACVSHRLRVSKMLNMRAEKVMDAMDTRSKTRIKKARKGELDPGEE